MCVRPKHEGKNCEKRECREHTPALLFVRANRVSLSRETPTRVCCTVRYIHPCARARLGALSVSLEEVEVGRSHKHGASFPLSKLPALAIR